MKDIHVLKNPNSVHVSIDESNVNTVHVSAKPELIPEGWDDRLIAHPGPLDLSGLIDTENPCMKKTPKGYEISLDGDAEWLAVANRPNTDITMQVRPVGYRSVAVMEHPELGLGILPTWKGITPLTDMLRVRERRRLNQHTPCNGLLVVKFFCFFSFGDVKSFFGEIAGRKIQRQCDQKRRIKVKKGLINIENYYLELKPGEWYQVCLDIQDVSAQMGIGGLKEYASKVNLKLHSKTSMDQYKVNMLEPYTNPVLLPDFIDYSAGDCVAELIQSRFKKLVLEEIYSLLNLDPPKDIPATTGAMVEKVFRDFLMQKVIKDTEFNKYLLPNLDPDNEVGEDWILGLASAKTWMDTVGQNTTSIYNLLVQGGRCQNEMPSCYKMFDEIIGDADIKGCYGNGLLNQIYPIGLPTQFVYGHRQQKLTLGKFLDLYEEELVPGLWHLVVDTKEDFSFEQNLIFSKPIQDSKFIRKVREKLEEDDPEVDVNFGLVTRELINGIIQHDTLQTLRGKCTAKEWSEFKNKVIVKSGAGYLKSHRCDSIEEMHACIKNDAGIITTELELKKGKGRVRQSIHDCRNRAWYGVHLSEFINPLLDKRTELKNLKKQYSPDHPLHFEYDAKQTLFKLFINTVYGVLASPYFKSGNTIVANNITARARCLAWMMSVACGGLQSITDGSSYDMNKVRFWNGYRPGLGALSTFNRNHLRDNRGTHRYISEGPLGGRQWKFKEIDTDGNIILYRGDELVKGSAEKWGLIDDLYLKHLQEFFRGCDIDILFGNDGDSQFKFEHKNIYRDIVLQSKSNYRLTEFNGTKKLKARGHSLHKEHYGVDGETRIHFDENGEPINYPAMMELFEEIAENRVTPKPATFTSQPLKVNAANAGGKKIDQNGLLAGDSIWKKSRIHPISLSVFTWPHMSQKKTWETIDQKFKAKLGWGLEAYFYDSQTGFIDYERAVKEIQQKIDDGAQWFAGITNLKSDKYWEKLPRNPLMEENEFTEPKDIVEKIEIEVQGCFIDVKIPKNIREENKGRFVLNRVWKIIKEEYWNPSDILKLPSDAELIGKIQDYRRRHKQSEFIFKS